MIDLFFRILQSLAGILKKASRETNRLNNGDDLIGEGISNKIWSF